MNSIDVLNALFSGCIGFFVGMSELANRYKSFAKLFIDISSGLYMGINFGAGFLAYCIVVEYQLAFGSFTSIPLGRVLFCGMSAMAFLRSSFFTVKDSSGKVFEVGPAALLSVFSRVAETEFDQLQSRQSIEKVEPIMRDLSFISASKDLPLIILASMRVLNAEEQKLLSDDITKLVNDNSVTSEAKNITLGLILLRYTGIDLLNAAASKLKEIYKTTIKANLDQIQEIKV